MTFVLAASKLLTMNTTEITLLGLFIGVTEVLGILTSIHAIMYTRTPQGAIAWFFPLVLSAGPVSVPGVAVVLGTGA